jgi:DMSO reductase anchor subunit
MKPALSVILFTVSSGAGLGLMAWVLVAQLAGRIDASQRAFWIASSIAAALLTLGLLSSTAHLASPRNAWRAVARFGSSWLSREGVLALALYPVAALHLWLSVSGSPLAAASAAVTLVLALGVVVCTAMIYACLKTVPRWRTWHTPVLFVLHALASGGLLWSAIGGSAGFDAGAAGGSVALAVVAVLVKVLFDAKFSARVHATLNDALAVPASAAPGRVQGRVRLLDAGHSHGTFLTHEFGFVLARERATALRATMYLATAGAPLLALTGGVLGWVAALGFLGGLLVERWLFFAQAQHVVRLYHGQEAV